MFRRIERAFTRYFFGPGSALELGINRCLYFSCILIYYRDKEFSYWADMPDVLWNPIALYSLVPVPIFPATVLHVLGVVWLISLALSAVGLFTRLSTIYAFVAGSYLFCLINSIGRAQRDEPIMILVFAVMAFSRCGDAFSIDAWLRRKGWRFPRFGRRVERLPMPGEYAWPAQTIRLVTTLVFCSAGAAKLRNSGLAWITSDHLSTVLISDHFRTFGSKPLFSGLPLWLGKQKLVCHVLAGLTVALEVGAPLSLMHRSFAVLIVPGLFLMMMSIWLILGIPFPHLIACFIFWIPWDRRRPVRF